MGIVLFGPRLPKRKAPVSPYIVDQVHARTPPPPFLIVAMQTPGNVAWLLAAYRCSAVEPWPRRADDTGTQDERGGWVRGSGRTGLCWAFPPRYSSRYSDDTSFWYLFSKERSPTRQGKDLVHRQMRFDFFSFFFFSFTSSERCRRREGSGHRRILHLGAGGPAGPGLAGHAASAACAPSLGTSC